jgi:aryl-alcohol dehydrogenase-like predicted oxidoreductase
VVAIPGASSVRQLEENAAASEVELSEDDSNRLDGFKG